VRTRAVAAVALVALAALVVLVFTGVLTGFDDYAIGRWMPWRQPSAPSLVHVRTVFLPETKPTTGATLVALWTYPASPLISALVVAACAYDLHRRGARTRAVGFLVLWLAANVLELVGKAGLARPALDVASFRHTFPSGHSLRAWIVAAAVTWTWRRGGLPAVAWATTVPIALVVLGDHTPTDVIAGVLLALCLIAATDVAVPAYPRGAAGTTTASPGRS
jgi:membrane-associated phospholipid phosphatase